MNIIMTGIDHTRADVDTRSIFSFTKKKMAEAYEWFRANTKHKGVVMISTCNRMELWADSETDGDELFEQICQIRELKPDKYRGYFYSLEGPEAVDHLFRLASGLESQIFGEDQIVTQVGDALRLARENYSTDPVLEVLFRHAVTAAKRVKTDVQLKFVDHSVIDQAIRMLEDKGIDLKDKKCMVIGNGMMGRAASEALIAKGLDVTVTVRQYRSGLVDIPFGCKRINYDDRMTLVPSCDIVVSATASPNFTLRLDQFEDLYPEKHLILIDLAVPRDIDPRIKDLGRFETYDIDDFHIDRDDPAVVQSLKEAGAILAEEEKEVFDYMQGKDLLPRIGKLKTQTAEDVEARLTKVYRKVPLEGEPLDQLKKDVDGAVERMMNHMLFGLKEELDDETFRRCFGVMETLFAPAEQTE